MDVGFLPSSLAASSTPAAMAAATGCYGGGMAAMAAYTAAMAGYDAPYAPPIFGYALQYNYGSMDRYQAPSSMTSPTPTPSEAVPPVPPNPVPSTPDTIDSDARRQRLRRHPPAPPAPANVVPPTPKPSA